MSLAKWKFDQRHLEETAVPRRPAFGSSAPEAGVVLACTLQSACAASGRISPPDYSSGNPRQDAECVLFKEFVELLNRLYDENMVSSLWVEEVLNTQKDCIIGHRLIANVTRDSVRLMDPALCPAFNGEGEPGEEGGEEDNDDNMDADALDDDEDDGDNNDAVSESQRWDRVCSSIEGALKSLFYVSEEGSASRKKKKSSKRRRTNDASRARQDIDRTYRFFQAMKRCVLEIDEIAEDGSAIANAFPNEPSPSHLCGKVHDGVFTASEWGGVNVYSLLSCLLRDEVIRGDRRFDLEDDEDAVPVFDFYSREQCEISNYFEIDDVLQDVREFNGVGFPRITGGTCASRVMRVSISHLRRGAIGLLPPPGAQFEEFMWRQRQRASEHDAVKLSVNNLRVVGRRRLLRSVLNPQLSAEEGNDAAITVRSKPAEFFDADALMQGLDSSETTLPNDPAILKKHAFYENPRDVAEVMREEDADVLRFSQARRAHNSEMEQLCAEWDTLEECEQRERKSAVLASRRHVENLACIAAEKGFLRAAQAARAKDATQLSEAQMACFGHEGTILSRMGKGRILQKVDTELSPFANWMQDLVIGLDEVHGVHTHHTQALFLFDAAKTAFISAEVMRNNTVQSGAAQAGKDFLRECVESLFPKGIFEATSATTEAARVDPERLLETGMVHTYSETPPWLMEHGSQTQIESGQEWVKRILTELRADRKKFLSYMSSNGEEVLIVTRLTCRARGMLIVNSNQAVTDATSFTQSHGYEAVLSRFLRLQQSIPSRKWGSITDGEKTASDVDSRLYTGVSGEQGVPLQLAKEQMQTRCHHNVRFHCAFGFLRTMRIVDDVDMAVFDFTKPHISRILKRYYGIVVMSRYAQQARNFAYVMALDDWWVRQFMLPNGFFVDGSKCAIGDGEVIAPVQLTRALYRSPPACTEEIALYAWQFMLTTGVVSHGILASVAKLLVHYMRNQAHVDKATLALVGGDERFRRFIHPSLRQHDDLQGNSFVNYSSTFNSFLKLYWEPPSAGEGEKKGDALQHFCEKLYMYNMKHGITDVRYSEIQMTNALREVASKQIKFRVPYASGLEFRRQDASGMPISVFSDAAAYDDFMRLVLRWPMLSEGLQVLSDGTGSVNTILGRSGEDVRNDINSCIMTDDVNTRGEKWEFVLEFASCYTAYGDENALTECRRSRFARACTRCLFDALNGERRGMSRWRGAMIFLEIFMALDKINVFVPAWESGASPKFDSWRKKLVKRHLLPEQNPDPAQENISHGGEAVDEAAAAHNTDQDLLELYALGLPRPLHIDWPTVLRCVRDPKLRRHRPPSTTEPVSSEPRLLNTGTAARIQRLLECNLLSIPGRVYPRHAQLWKGTQDQHEDHSDVEAVSDEDDNNDDEGLRQGDLVRDTDDGNSDEVLLRYTDKRGADRMQQQQGPSKPGSSQRYLEIDVQCVLYWSKQLDASSLQEEFVRHYAHSAVRPRNIVINENKVQADSSRQEGVRYDRLRTVSIQPNDVMFFSKNPRSVSKKVSERLISNASAEMRAKWSKECCLVHNTLPLDEWAQAMRDPLRLAAQLDRVRSHPCAHLIDPELLYGSADCCNERAAANAQKDSSEYIAENHQNPAAAAAATDVREPARARISETGQNAHVRAYIEDLASYQSAKHA